jgi:hypothetical protein
MGGVLVLATREALFQLGMIPQRTELETREAVNQLSQNGGVTDITFFGIRTEY